MEIVSAIVTSFIASVVFYLCFQYLPEKRRYNRIRPRIEVELMEITDSLFFYIEMPLRHEIHSSSFFQKEIREGKLVKEDFELGLYNKCLNDSYVYDENSNLMIVIGDKLKYHADQLSLGIRNVLMSQQFLTSDEILIIEDINRLLYTYQYDGDANLKVGTSYYRPVNPTLSYMSDNFYKLYCLWSELRHKMFRYTYIRKEERQGEQRFFTLQWERINWELKHGNYERASEIIDELSIGELPDFQVEVLEYLRLRIEIEIGYIEHAKAHLERIIKDRKRERLVYERGFFECIEGNKELMSLCSKLCSEDEIAEWNNVVGQEKRIKDHFIKQNNYLKDYYENKTKGKSV